MNVRLLWHDASESYHLDDAESGTFRSALEQGCEDVTDLWDEHVEPWMRRIVAGKQAKVTFGEGRDHAILSASGSKKWLVCTPSAQLEETIEDTDSEYSAEGSFAHALGAWRLAHWLNRISHPQFMFGIECMKRHRFWSIDLFDHVATFVDYAKKRINEALATDPSAVVILEQRLDYSRWVPEGFGTGDVVIITNSRIIVIDLKFGQGVAVYPEDNEQAKMYAGGALNEIEYSEFVVKTQAFADAVNGTATFSDMLEEVARARELEIMEGLGLVFDTDPSQVTDKGEAQTVAPGTAPEGDDAQGSAGQEGGEGEPPSTAGEPDADDSTESNQSEGTSDQK